MTAALFESIGAVVIGRNEGERLKVCLASVRSADIDVVYVDSGSTDDSVATARAMGASVIELDTSKPFTAARARNAGWRQMLYQNPEVRYIQFIDGDCEVHAAWWHAARSRLDAAPMLAAVCGRLRERYPESSIFNAMCDAEWDTPIGPTRACGGIAAMRTEALRRCGGFREDLIAGEEPELCIRLRAAGWQIERLPAEMAMHDAAMYRWSQWWRRSRRAGHAYAEGSHLHGAPPERHWVLETRRALLWGLAVPAAAAVTSLGSLWGLLVLGLFPMQMVRLAVRWQREGRRRPWAQAFFMVLGKVPEAFGVLTYQWRRATAAEPRLIEHK